MTDATATTGQRATATATAARASGEGVGEVAALARRLFPAARAAFLVAPEAARGPLYAALDAFMQAPAPSTFVAAHRVLSQTRRRLVIEQAGHGVLRRGFAEGVAALRGVSSLPPSLTDALASHLPLDARAGDRLTALAALAGAYQELSARVAADGDRRRRLWKTAPRRRPRPSH